MTTTTKFPFQGEYCPRCGEELFPEKVAIDPDSKKPYHRNCLILHYLMALSTNQARTLIDAKGADKK